MNPMSNARFAVIALIALTAASTLPWAVAASTAGPRSGPTPGEVVHPGDSADSATPLTVTLSPTQGTILSGASAVYTATVTSTYSSLYDEEFQWSLSSSGAGTISASGASATFTAFSVSHPTPTTLSVSVSALSWYAVGQTLSGSAQLSIEAIPPLVVGSLSVNPDPVAPGTQVGLSVPVSYGEAPYQIQFNCGDGSVILSDLANAATSTVNHLYLAGTYSPSVTVTDAGGETVTTTADSTLVVAAGMAVSLAGTREIDTGSTITLTASATGGDAPYSYLWKSSDGQGSSEAGQWQFTPSITGAVAVSLTVTDSLGDSASSGAFLMQVNPAPSLAISSTTGSADVGTALPLVASIRGGTAPYQLAWSDPSQDASFATSEETAGNYPLPYTFEKAETVVLQASLTDADGVTVSIDSTVGQIQPLPTVNLQVSPSDPTVGGAISAYATLGGGTPPYSYEFDFAGPTSSGGPVGGSLSRPGVVPWTGTLTGSGTLTIGISVTDAAGGQGSGLVTVDGLDALASGLSVPMRWGEIGQSLAADISAFGGVPPYSYTVTGSDGESTSGMLPQSGEYSVALVPRAAGNVSFSLLLSDARGQSTSAKGVIFVEPELTALLGWGPQVVDAGETLRAVVSGGGGCAPYTATLTSSAGTNTVFDGFQTPQNTTLVFEQPGSYSLNLSLTDSCGVTSSRMATVEVTPDPVATLTLSSSHTEVGVPIAVYVGTQGGVGPFQTTVSFGDGMAADSSTVQHPYSQPGTYLVNATVQDGTGAHAATAPIAVTVVPDPQALATVAITSADVGHAVAFSSSVQYGTAPYSYLWNFGDGVSSDLADPTHTFAATGTYHVALAVTDAVGQISQSPELNVTVFDPPLLSLSANRTVVEVGQPVLLSAAEINGAGAPSLVWEFADGAAASGPVVQHAYATPGTYSVTARLTDGAGVTVSSSVEITVGPSMWLPPVATGSSELEAGTSTILHAYPSGGVAPYRINWNCGGTVADGTDLYNFTVVPTHSGPLSGWVNVSDASGTVVGEPFTLAVAPSLSLNVSMSLHQGEVGVPYVIEGTPMGGVGPYDFSYYLPTGAATGWNLTSLTWTPTNRGTQSITVSVRDSLGVTASVDLEATVAPPLGVVTAGSTVYVDAGTVCSLPFVISGGVGPVSVTEDTPMGEFANGTRPIFSVPGTYPVGVVAQDSDGAMSTTWMNVTVVPALQIAIGRAPSEVAVGDPQSFVASLSGGYGPFSVVWQVPKVGSWNGTSASVDFPESGNYTLDLTAADSAGGRASLQWDVRAYNDSLSLRAGATSVIGLSPFAPTVVANLTGEHPPIDLELSVDGDAYSNTTFDTGVNSWSVAPILSGPGSHSLQFVAQDRLGLHASASLNVTVCSPLAPVEIFPAAPRVPAGGTVQFHVTLPNVACSGTSVAENWWGAGIVAQSPDNATFEWNESGEVTDHLSERLIGLDDSVLENITVPYDVTVMAGPAVRIGVEEVTSRAVVGTNVSLRAFALDALGNENYSYNGTLDLTGTAEGEPVEVPLSSGFAILNVRSERAGTSDYELSSYPLAPANVNISWMADAAHVTLRVLQSETVRSALILNVSVTDEFGNPLTGIEVTASTPGLPPVMANSTEGLVVLDLPGGAGASTVTLTGPGGATTTMTMSSGSGVSTGSLVTLALIPVICVGIVLGYLLFRKHRRESSGDPTSLAEEKKGRAKKVLEDLIKKWSGEDRGSLLEMAEDQKVERGEAIEALSSLEREGKAERHSESDGEERWTPRMPSTEAAP